MATFKIFCPITGIVVAEFLATPRENVKRMLGMRAYWICRARGINNSNLTIGRV